MSEQISNDVICDVEFDPCDCCFLEVWEQPFFLAISADSVLCVSMNFGPMGVVLVYGCDELEPK